MTDNLYTYKGEVFNVVDGDTVDAKLDLGFGITMNQRFRIIDLDTPEIFRPRNEAEKQHGREAKLRAQDLLQHGPVSYNLIFHTSKKPGIYGRYAAKITLADDRDFAEVMVSEGYSKKESYDD